MVAADRSLVERWLNLAEEAAAGVPDPELPFLSVGDLGILRSFTYRDNRLYVKVSPTYTGCPAVSVIETMVHDAIVERLSVDAQVSVTENRSTSVPPEVVVERSLSPAWTTGDLSEEAHRKLRENGIAPPVVASSSDHAGDSQVVQFKRGTGTESTPSGERTGYASATKDRIGLFAKTTVCCPHCQSNDTAEISRFGSTPCKAQYRCNECLEPFDYFKCLI